MFGTLVITDLRTFGVPCALFVSVMVGWGSGPVASVVGLVALLGMIVAISRIYVEVSGSHLRFCNGGRSRTIELPSKYVMAPYRWNSKWMCVPFVHVGSRRFPVLAYWGLSEEEQVHLLRVLGRSHRA